MKTFPNNALGTQVGQLAQLREGSIQMVMTLNANYASVVPVAAIDSLGYVFVSQRQPFQVLDGPLGAYLRREFQSKGIHCFEKGIEGGFRQVSSSTHPIRNVDDFNGFKIRTPPAKVYVDLFKAFGASPVPVDAAELYTSLQTRIVDGQETPLEYIESARIYEVQKYISLTNHIWAGYWITANMDAWNALSPDLQAVVARNASKYTLMEREDVYKLNNTIADKLKQQGMTINTTDTSGMRPRLGAYFAYWKDQFGSTAWGLLEAAVGKLT